MLSPPSCITYLPHYLLTSTCEHDHAAVFLDHLLPLDTYYSSHSLIFQIARGTRTHTNLRDLLTLSCHLSRFGASCWLHMYN